MLGSIPIIGNNLMHVLSPRGDSYPSRPDKRANRKQKREEVLSITRLHTGVLTDDRQEIYQI